MDISRHLDKFVFLNNVGLNRQLSANSNGTLHTDTNRLYWETWGVELADASGAIYLRSDHGTLLGVDANGAVTQRPASSRTASEQWRVEQDLSGNLLLTSVATGKHLSVVAEMSISSSPGATPAEQWRIEEASAALKLDGQTAYVDLPSMSPDLGGGLTIEAWVYYDAVKSWARIIDLGNADGAEGIFLANVGLSGDLQFAVRRAGTWRSITAAGALGTGYWMHLAATLDLGGYGRLYKNGVLVAQGQMHLPSPCERVKNYIGKSNAPGDGLLAARVSEVRLWSVARQPEQIAGALGRRLHGDEAGLCGDWRLDEASGVTARDAGPGGLHGRFAGETGWSPARLAMRSFLAPLDESDVLAFGGPTARVQLPAMNLDLARGLTVEAWVLLKDTLGWARILTMQTGYGPDQILFLCDGSGTGFGLRGVNTSGGEGGAYAPANTVPVGQWTHLCGVFDPAGECRLYRNGQLVAAAAAPLPKPGARANCMIGKSPETPAFPGLLAEVRVWTGVRSEAQIRATMSRGLQGREDDLAGYWKLDDGAATTVRDRSRYERSGTREGGCVRVASFLPIEPPRARLTTVTHEGKVLMFATRPDGRVQYTAKQSGFEDSVSSAPGTAPGWEPWKTLALPDQPDDVSVTSREQATLTYDGVTDKYVLRSWYRSAGETAYAPVQAVSAFGFVYVFRQSSAGSILVDRFVLDGLKNELVPKLEVRFKRSRQRYTPQAAPGQQAADGGFDSLDFTDADGKPFFEPSTQLGWIRGVHDGLFAIVLLPTADSDRQRWHIFLHNSNLNKIVAFSILSSEAGLFDPYQRTYNDGTTVPGVERTVIDLGAAPARSLCAVRYDLQEEQAAATGEKVLLRTAVRVMLAVEGPQGTSVLSFAAAGDGTLSRLVETPTKRVTHSERRTQILPPTTLENIKAVQVNPPVAGVISGLRRGDGDHVTVQSAGAGALDIGDSVEIAGTRNYNGRYTVKAVAGDTFEIEVDFTTGESVGKWAKVDDRETGLVFDGAVTSYSRLPNNRLAVTAPNHGLLIGDAVQLTGTADYNGIYPVQPIDAGQFAIDAPWVLGSALGVKNLTTRKRRGLTLNGANEYVEVLAASVPNGGASYTVEAWIRPRAMAPGGITSWGVDGATRQSNVLALTATGLIHRWGNDDLSVTTSALTDGWHHVAATYDAAANRRRIYLDGAEIAADSPSAPLAIPATANRLWIGRARDDRFAGVLADVRVWSVARTREQLASAMFEQLNGQENGLCGYWKLSAIAEGELIPWGLAFDGVDDCGQLADTPALRLGAYTVEAWIKPEKPTQEKVGVLGKPGRNFNLWIYSDGRVHHRFHTSGPGGSTNDGAPDLAAGTIRWGEWNHIAITNDGQTARTFYNGVERTSVSLAGKTLVPDNTPLILGRNLDGQNMEYFKGVMTEVRLWNVARAADQIVAFRDRALVGNEGGLVGYWPVREDSGAGLVDLTANKLNLGMLGGATVVVADAPVRSNLLRPRHKVYDFSPAGREGVVVGAPTISQVELTRPQGPQSPQSPPIEYLNDELVAVVRGGVYEESVDLRPDDGVAPGLKFAHWFKERSDSPAPDVTLTPVAATVTDIGGGWFRATCQFTAPATTSLMRAFKITEVTGAWTKLELRRHQLTELPAPITEWEYLVSPVLPAISNAPSDLDDPLSALAAGERAEGALLVEQRVLEDKLRLAADPTLNTQLAAAQAQLAAAEAARNNLIAVRAAQDQMPMLSYCRVIPRHSNMTLAIDGASTSHGALLCQVDWHNTPNEWFFADPNTAPDVFTVPALNQWFLLRPAHNPDMVVDVENWSLNDGARLHQWLYSGNENQWFRFEQVPGAPDTYVIRAKQSNKVLDVRGASDDANADVIQYGPNGGANQQFIFQRLRDSPRITDTRAALAVWERDVQLARSEVSRLQGIINARDASSAAWQARLTALAGELTAIRSKIAEYNAKLLSAIRLDADKGPTELVAFPKESKRGLSTLGGVLGFVRSSGRITALQTCDGDIQLNYVDVRGRTREVRYQGTRDSNGLAAGGWRPTGARGGLHFLDPAAVVSFDRPFRLGAEWTVEAWFQHPLPKTAECNTLIATEGNGEIQVRANMLGVWLGRFYDCGFDVRGLSHGWHHLAAVASGAGAESTIVFYVDGARVGDTRSVARQRAAGNQAAMDALTALDMKAAAPVVAVGNQRAGSRQFGRLAELRFWSVALKPAEIVANSRGLLTGREPGLVAYFPMTGPVGNTLSDMSGNANHGTITGAPWIAFAAPIGRHGDEPRAGALVVAEYDTIGVDPDGTRTALMRRAVAVETPRGVRLYSERRVEELDLRWVGNAQFQPTLLGFIEGPPPVPSENLTLSDNYNGAAAVELTTAEDVTFQWNRTKESKAGGSTDGFIGFDTELDWENAPLGIGISFPQMKGRFGVKMQASGAVGEARTSTITAQSGLKMSNRIELRGTLEPQPRFPELGSRFIPKSVGYALVVSGLADVYITSLKRSGRMVGYEVVPNRDIEPDVNTVSFLLNPAYTMAGSLDGMTGSRPTSERFFAHVPELRAQHGSNYPASYYRLQEAYDLKSKISKQDKDREAYFYNFDAMLNAPGPLGDDQLGSAIDDGPAPDEDGDAAASIENTLAESARSEAEYTAKLDARRKQIEQSFADREQLYNATRGLDRWQQRMEDLRIRAGKRNIVNTYVWDANGGLHTEEQQFASSVQHSVGSNTSAVANFGLDAKYFSVGFGFELTALANLQWSELLTKTVSTSRGFGLNVSLAGVESRGVTDHKDRPLVPGEKVGRYRFMSFFLEGSTRHFDDFYGHVVDPEWLIGNSENARALREARGRTNKAWRVLHRVTYVERPALANFGADLRPLPAPPAAPPLDKRVESVESKLDLALQLLRALQTS